MAKSHLVIVMIVAIVLVAIQVNDAEPGRYIWEELEDSWNDLKRDAKKAFKDIFHRGDCAYIKADLDNYNRCANQHYPDHHKKLPLYRQHYRKNSNTGHKLCFQEFRNGMTKFTDGYDKFDSCFRQHVHRDRIEKCARYVYE
ncbi:unnamed protein product [Medioppia subpectinata]|uniref:Uncharacterized protein n=1 Tax=Medioppia subpectinata TaxID=1979941 RepID=A0A7R9LES7_9ACAR|nr:unnamed protein product [Medioppia subpectinata]CAG2117667.1 unnamed protein product [Medioppia subpectinata]